jgi:hypothetical protein
VAHGVNPAVKGVEVTVANASYDLLLREAARAQFVEGEHAPLVRRVARIV